jgi:hypothetical protein
MGGACGRHGGVEKHTDSGMEFKERDHLGDLEVNGRII